MKTLSVTLCPTRSCLENLIDTLPKLALLQLPDLRTTCLVISLKMGEQTIFYGRVLSSRGILWYKEPKAKRLPTTYHPGCPGNALTKLRRAFD